MASATDASLGLSVPASEVLDPARWTERYGWAAVATLPSARLKDAAGKIITSIPPDTIRWHLRCAMSEAALKIGVPMGTRVVKGDPVDSGLVQGRDYDVVEPRRPYYSLDTTPFTYTRIDLPPGVISIQRVRAYVQGTMTFSMTPADDPNAIHLQYPEAGTLRIMNTITTGLVLNANLFISTFQLLGGYGSICPDVWSVDYTMGPVDDLGRPGQIDCAVAHWINCKASITLINQVGLAQSKGLSSTSVGFDGFSRSVSLQASAMYGINSCLEKVYNDACESINWKTLRMRHRGIPVRSYNA